MKIALIPNKIKDIGYEVSSRVMNFLLSSGAELYIEKKYADAPFSGLKIVDELPRGLDLIIVFGGDGSVIDASVQATELDIPILCVNLGNLGYLAEIEPSEIEKLSGLFDGNYSIEERMLLSCSVKCGEEYTESERLAVNEVLVSHESYVGLAQLKLTESNGAGVKYRADGLILSTPAGSTAYSLSAGGPIVAHNLDSIIVTPVCPHSFFNRSIVYEPDECITVSNAGESVLNVSLDGRLFTKLRHSESCVVHRSSERLKMITFSKNNLFSTLVKKIKVLEDKI